MYRKRRAKSPRKKISRLEGTWKKENRTSDIAFDRIAILQHVFVSHSNWFEWFPSSAGISKVRKYSESMCISYGLSQIFLSSHFIVRFVTNVWELTKVLLSRDGRLCAAFCVSVHNINKVLDPQICFCFLSRPQHGQNFCVHFYIPRMCIWWEICWHVCIARFATTFQRLFRCLHCL